jgi:ankyrin repeat protein
MQSPQGLLIFAIIVMMSMSSLGYLVKSNRSSVRRSLTKRNFWPFDSVEKITGVAIIDAIQTRNQDSVKSVLSRGDDNVKSIINEKDVDGNNALHIIAKKGHYKFPPAEIPKLLIDNGIDINAKNAKGDTPLGISLLSGWQVQEVHLTKF